MSQRTITTDDLTGREAPETAHYHLAVTDTPGSRTIGDKYEIDLSPESHAAFVALLTGQTAEFHAYMSRIITPAPAPSDKPAKRAPGSAAPANPDNNAMRLYARSVGIMEPAKNPARPFVGVIPGKVKEAWAGMPETDRAAWRDKASAYVIPASATEPAPAA